MADLTADQAIEKLRGLPAERQRAILARLSPESKKGILARLKSSGGASGSWEAPESTLDKIKAGGLTASYDPGAREFQEKTDPITGTAVRGLSSLGGAVLGIPGGIYHAFADPLTPEEEQEFNGHYRIPGEVAVERLTGAPLVRGVKAYIDPKTRPTLSQAASVLPEALGTGAGSYVGGELVGMAAGKAFKTVGELRKAAKEQAHGLARQATGARYGAKESVIKAGSTQAEDIAANRAKRLEIAKENLTKQRAKNTEIDREKVSTAEKNRAIEAENKAQAEQVKKRGEMAKDVDTRSNALRGQLEDVEQSVAKEANKKFEDVRAKVGNPETSPDALIAAVKNAQTNILQDIPENVKEFRSILGMEGEAEGPLTVNGAEIHPGEPGYEQIKAAYKEAGLLNESKPLTWDKLQSLKSRLDARLRKAQGMNGDLKRALYSTRESVIDEMGKMAEANGAGKEWAAARDFWRQYKEDFHESTGPSGSGSPVAQSINAADPKNVRQPFLRTQSSIGNRGVDILRKYPQHGGTEAANAVEGVLKSHKEMLDLPAKESPKPLKTAPEVHQMPESKPLPKQPGKPMVDLDETARSRIAATAQSIGKLNAWDARIIATSAIATLLSPFLQHGSAFAEVGIGYVGGKLALSRMLENPKVIDWIARTPQNELAVLQKLPNAQLVNIKATLRQAVQQSKVPPSPTLARFLGITAAANVNIPKTPGEARDRMRQYAPTAP